MTEVEIGNKIPKATKRRVWPWILGGLLALVAVAGVLLFLLFPRLLLRYIEREARAQGVVLRDCSLSYSLEKLELSKCSFELVEVPSVSGSVEKLTVAIADFAPKSALIEGAQIVVRELPNVPTGELIPRWLEQRGKVGKDAKVALEVRTSRLDLFGTSDSGAVDSQPLVTLTDIAYDSATEALTSNITIGELLVGKLSHKGSRSELDVSLKMSPETRGRFSIDGTAEGAEVRADFEKLPLALFSMPPFIELPEELATAQVDGRVYAVVPFGLDTKGIRGDFSLTVAGMPMPVPREIQGLVYGPFVSINGKFKLHPNNQKMDITQLQVKSGVLELAGAAQVEVKGLRVPLQSSLRGSLSCGAILEAATRAHSDSPLAINAAKLGRKMLKGGVEIVVALDADLLRLKEAKLLRTIGIGCGLQPMPIPEELAGLPEKILKGIPRPRLPDPPEVTFPPRLELPRLPEFPPRRRLDEGRPAPSNEPPP